MEFLKVQHFRLLFLRSKLIIYEKIYLQTISYLLLNRLHSSRFSQYFDLTGPPKIVSSFSNKQMQPIFHIHLSLYLESYLLPYSNTKQFLGLVQDKKLAWVPDIYQIKAQCIKLLHLLRSLSSLTWGADQYCCLEVNCMFIKAKLEYGCIVYDSASRSTLLSSDTSRGLEVILRSPSVNANGIFTGTPQ